jgi:excisionase family DNA binding protein
MMFLKTQQVARALGVSVSTIKRWVDSGTIQATRTAGKHRLIPRVEAERLAREFGLTFDADRLAGDGEDSDAAPKDRPFPTTQIRTGTITSDLVDELVATMRRGRSHEVRDLIHQAYHAAGPVALADQLIQPAMVRIGHDWEVHGIDVYQEHRATRMVKLALFELIQQAEAAAGPLSADHLAIGCSPEADPYMLPGLLCELTLRSLGWDVMNLGVNMPMPSLGKAVRAHRPRLVFLTVSYLPDLEPFLDGYARFFEAATACGTAVILGGQALRPDVRARMLAASFGDRMAHLAEFARLLTRPEAAAPSVRTGADPNSATR